MEREPDFFGNWSVGNPLLGALASAFDDYGSFRMYVNGRPPLREGVEKITGTIEDQYDWAMFDGELSGQEMSFMKIYSPQAIARGAAPNGVRYAGIKFPDSFRGKFTVVNGTSGGVTADWQGEFYVIPTEAIRGN